MVCLFIGSSVATPNGKEIEARRRSALDKNFMRFGRNYPNPHMLFHLAALKQEQDAAATGKAKRNTAAPKETRTPVKNGNFMRFGRAGNSFMRLGRSNSDDDQAEMDPMDVLMMRPQIRASNSFLRFGRAQSPVLVPAEAIWPLPMWQQQQPGVDGEVEPEEPLDDPELVMHE